MVLLKNDYIFLVVSILAGYSLSVSFGDTSFSILRREIEVFQGSCPSLLIHIPTPGNVIYFNEFHCHAYIAGSSFYLQTRPLSKLLAFIANILLNNSVWTSHENCQLGIFPPTMLFPSVFPTSVNGNKYSKLSRPLSITRSKTSSALYKPLSSLDKTLASYCPSSIHSPQAVRAVYF